MDDPSQAPSRSLSISKLGGWIAVAVMVILLFSRVPSLNAQQAGNIGPADGRQVTLRQQLTVGLKAFTPADRLFINRVILAVQQGRLPREMVDTTFLWARKRAVLHSYSRQFRPMVYFQPALTLRARAIGVTI